MCGPPGRLPELAVIALQNSRLMESLEASESACGRAGDRQRGHHHRDSRSQIASWNHRAEMMFGYTADEMVGSPMVHHPRAISHGTIRAWPGP
jgi:PAS domain-containing protein